MKSAREESDGPIIIKKYPNRRLYNTESSSYATLEHLAQMVWDGRDFLVRDARSNEDITRTVLLQVIFEEENKGRHFLPVEFLRRLIRFYGDNPQTSLPSDTEMAMEKTARDQEIRELKEQLAAMREEVTRDEEQN